MSHALTETRRPDRVQAALDWAFAGHRFPAFTLTLVALYAALLGGLLAFPAAPTGLGAFAEDFRIWCFGLDPATGRLQPMYVVTMFLQPVVLGAGVWLLFGANVRARWRERRRAFLPAAGAALLAVSLGAAAFGSLRGTRAADNEELPFPAEALRTELPAPRFRLTAQDGAPLSLEDLRGHVVLLTAVYASCHATCPMILGQTKDALAALDPADRADVRVVAVTLDPARDDVARLAGLAQAQGVSRPDFSLLTGAPAEVERALDDMSVARRRNPETGEIDHANLFLLLDRKGRIAYRLSLGDRHRQWLPTALRLLAREP